MIRAVSLHILLLFCAVSSAVLYEGQECELPDKRPGTCLKLTNCPSVRQGIEQGVFPQQCSFIRDIPVVCCPKIQDIPNTNSLSEQMCKSFRTSAPRLIRTIPKSISEEPPLFIVGGTSAAPREFSHMAALGFTSENKKLWLCGGSLISEQFILTAAHCLSSPQYGFLTWARLGDLNLESTNDDAGPENYKISRRIAHPDYKSPASYNDIALLKLERTVVFNSFVRPACLHTEKNLPADAKFTAIGWGLTQYGGNQSDSLQKVDLELFTVEECKATYKSLSSTRKLKNGILTEQQICAGGRNNEKDTCQGDSGGPLQMHSNDFNLYTIVGITSFGKVCGTPNIPGVYTRVAYYVPWIESIVWPNK